MEHMFLKCEVKHIKEKCYLKLSVSLLREMNGMKCVLGWTMECAFCLS